MQRPSPLKSCWFVGAAAHFQTIAQLISHTQNTDTHRGTNGRLRFIAVSRCALSVLLNYLVLLFLPFLSFLWLRECAVTPCIFPTPRLLQSSCWRMAVSVALRNFSYGSQLGNHRIHKDLLPPWTAYIRASSSCFEQCRLMRCVQGVLSVG